MTTSMPASPFRIVLGTLRAHGVRALLMGGQACVLYGAAQFSRDTDVALAIDPENLARLDRALRALRAELIAVPPFTADVLARGLAPAARRAGRNARGAAARGVVARVALAAPR